MVKKSGKTCRKHGGRIKNCKMRANRQNKGSLPAPTKNCKQIRRQHDCCYWQPRATRAARALVSIFRLPKGSFCPPALALQCGLYHILLNGGQQKKFRQFVARYMAAKKYKEHQGQGLAERQFFCGAVWARFVQANFQTGAGVTRPNARAGYCINSAHRASRARRALPRWLRAFFSSLVSSAAVLSTCLSKKMGS